MPPDIKKQLNKLKHPKSRKTQSLTKKLKKSEKKEQNKLGTHIKQNLIGEKLLWFQKRLPEAPILTKKQVLVLMEEYLSRFDEELEQIALKNSVGKRKNRQHAGREDVLNMNRKREKEEFLTCGLEMPDLLDHHQVQVLKEWNGELRYLQNFKLTRIAKKHLE